MYTIQSLGSDNLYLETVLIHVNMLYHRAVFS